MRRLFRSEPAAAPGLDVGALAPLVDMMTLMLVFLLRSYATEPAPSPPEGRFDLAATVSEDPRRAATEVLLSQDGIWVEGGRVTDLDGPDDLIRPVYDRLLAIRDHARIEVHADRDVRWQDLRRVLFTARAAGYGELSLVGASRSGL